MDGIDGIATSQAGLVALTLIVGSCFLAGSCPMVGGLADRAVEHGALLSSLCWHATLGFLPFNVPRARIFLGDVGSGALGCRGRDPVVARSGCGRI